MIWKKYAKKVGRNLYRAARKRYTKKSGNVNVKRIVKDVSFLKSVLNPEKKRYLINNTSNTPVGQVNGNTYGFFSLDVTPIPPVGTGFQQRNGASIRLHSSYLHFQLFDQSATSHPVKVKFMLCRVKGTPQNPVTSVGQMVSANPFLNPTVTPIYDFNSSLNPDYLGQYQCIRTWMTYLTPDNVSGQRIIKNVKIGIKYKNHHIRYNQDTNTISNGQLILLAFCDSGNMSSTTACTIANVPVTAINTGISMNYNLLHYYYDN